MQDKNLVIDNDYLSQFEGYQEFMNLSEKEHENQSPKAEVEQTTQDQTPTEVMESAYNEINAQLADELMSNIMEQDPAFFERLVIDRLEKMGYGSEISESGVVTGKTGDEGIDGTIRQDALGLDKIYAQAKRWSKDHTVGEPEIQQFAGALMGKGATKGLFITTSSFSSHAREYVEKHLNTKIVLVDGDALTKLMIRYGLGVSTFQTYEIKRVDSDYFNPKL